MIDSVSDSALEKDELVLGNRLCSVGGEEEGGETIKLRERPGLYCQYILGKLEGFVMEEAMTISVQR